MNKKKQEWILKKNSHENFESLVETVPGDIAKLSTTAHLQASIWYKGLYDQSKGKR